MGGGGATLFGLLGEGALSLPLGGIFGGVSSDFNLSMTGVCLAFLKLSLCRGRARGAFTSTGS